MTFFAYYYFDGGRAAAVEEFGLSAAGQTRRDRWTLNTFTSYLTTRSPGLKLTPQQVYQARNLRLGADNTNPDPRSRDCVKSDDD